MNPSDSTNPDSSSPPPPPSSSSSSSAFGTIFTSTDNSIASSSSTSGESSGGSGEIPAAVIPEPVVISRCFRRQARVSWGYTSVIGRRSEMEDAVAVVPDFMSCTCRHVGGCTSAGLGRVGDVSPVHFFGVYDGHGGSEVANYCAQRMHEVITDEWSQEGHDGHEWQRKWQETFCSGFRRVDDLVITEGGESETVGSTAVVAVVSGCQIIISNCGDSRAILCKRTQITPNGPKITQTIPLSVDHKPDREDELSRIEGVGGKVFTWNGARVSGVLAMSRAIGDRYLRPYVIPVPEITFTTRSEEDECLILASDGLWDVMKNEEVGKVASNLLRQMRRSVVAGDKSPAQVVADTLTELAIGRNSSDNISIIVVDLKPRRRHQVN
ncbi:protein phosphatase 2C 56-like [Silene latifolia]|uniref:protein phosphatase 2C 56-like n=1 Tax=Silene latifolia TaxID=37657 RepID=UPI003D76E2A3